MLRITVIPSNFRTILYIFRTKPSKPKQQNRSQGVDIPYLMDGVDGVGGGIK